ncbi:GNAT family N-acetyltransferase [uncultured Maribacter sp.]|uniref:GNAT family N-acetyltransferase n=1 Tax=uncultured Maribacter sp. TaxID=431308 RepID=UPI0030EB8CF5|tara:strand:+ start:29965 stop:30489 length:525 start_codon:yes stop_codon:yes gene_type:complete
MELSYKPCSFNDLSQLMLISRKTFVEAFENDNDPLDFKNYIDRAFSNDTLAIELQNTESHFYFVYHEQTLVAYFKLNEGNAQTDGKLVDSIELERIYVIASYQGKRLGEEILNQIKHIALQRKKNSLWLGVWEHNQRAIKFYQRNAFKKFGTHPYFIGNDEQTDWLMRFDLSTL